MSKYTVSICPDCQNVWIIKDEPDRTTCGRCGKSHIFGDLRHLKQTDSKQEARNYVAFHNANLQDNLDEFRETKNEDGILEPDTIQKGNQSKPETEQVRDLIIDLDSPSEDEVVEEAVNKGVSEEKAEKVLAKLRERGDIIGKDELRLV